MIFHELAHQKIYIKGDSKFNEGFAVAVEREGLRQWLSYIGDKEALSDIEKMWRVKDSQIQHILDTKDELSLLYSKDLKYSEMLAEKTEILKKLKITICDTDCLGKKPPRAESGELEYPNNAYIIAVDTYYGYLPAFEKLLNFNQRNLYSFYTDVEKESAASQI